MKYLEYTYTKKIFFAIDLKFKVRWTSCSLSWNSPHNHHTLNIDKILQQQSQQGINMKQECLSNHMALSSLLSLSEAEAAGCFWISGLYF